VPSGAVSLWPYAFLLAASNWIRQQRGAVKGTTRTVGSPLPSSPYAFCNRDHGRGPE
jgi:hypothetical protein